MSDVVNHPRHYEDMASTITIQPHELLRDFDFYLGKGVKNVS